MKNLNKFIYFPGGENEAGSTSNESEKEKVSNPQATEEKTEHKSVLDKIKDALHDWSNKDQQDQQFDDTRV